MVWGLVAGVAAVGMEIAYKRGYLAWNHWPSLVVIIPLAILVNYAVYRNIVDHGSFLQAMVWFGLITAAGRIAFSFLWLHEAVDVRSVGAAAALAVGVALRVVR